MDASRSRMLCPINSLNILNTMLFPSQFTHIFSQYNEQHILRFFQGYSDEQKEVFLRGFLKPENQLSDPPFPIDFDLFNEETRSMITLEIHFLGMDTN